MTTPVEGNHWRNWSGLVEATADRVVTPSSVDAVVDVVRQARDSGTTVKMTGTGHSFTAIAAPEHTLLRPEGMSGIARRRPRRDDRHRPRRDSAPRAQPRARAPRALAAQHGRHRRADDRGGHLHRHPRHRRPRRGALGADGRARAGHGHRRGGPRLRRGEPRRLRHRPRRARRPRHPHHADLPGRAALRHRGARAADDVGQRARLVRRDGGRDRTTSTCTGSPTPTG